MEPKLLFQTLTIFFVAFASVKCYSSGPPTKVCKRLTPGHPLISYKGTSARLSAEKIPNEGRWLVKIESEVPFKGFIVQGRKKPSDSDITAQESDSSGEPLGVFSESKNYRLMNCFRKPANTISHFDTSSKNVIEAEWDPEGYSGPIEFKSVVVYEFELGQKLAIDLEI